MAALPCIWALIKDADMKRTASRLTLAVLMGLGLAAHCPSVCSAGDAATPIGLDSRADRNGLPADMQPWWPSRYGADDQLGTLNEITPKVVRAATALVKTGTVVDLGRVLDDDTPKFPGRYWHQTVDVSPHFGNLRRPDTHGKGWGGLWGKDNTEFLSGEPGPGMEVVNWLYEQRIALTGADTWSFGPVPGEDPERPFLVPQTMYVKMGMFGLENLATEELAQRGVHEFLFTFTHAKTRGSTAAVIAPAAVY
jgi:hypothetical protein